jgi:hypothetical protein
MERPRCGSPWPLVRASTGQSVGARPGSSRWCSPYPSRAELSDRVLDASVLVSVLVVLCARGRGVFAAAGRRSRGPRCSCLRGGLRRSPRPSAGVVAMRPPSGTQRGHISRCPNKAQLPVWPGWETSVRSIPARSREVTMRAGERVVERSRLLVVPRMLPDLRMPTLASGVLILEVCAVARHDLAGERRIAPLKSRSSASPAPGFAASGLVARPDAHAQRGRGDARRIDHHERTCPSAPARAGRPGALPR